jgi:ATP/maltotriose-dependent transcriptional regulator MalT
VAVSRIAKITRPILSEVYPRKRLFEALDTLRKWPVIWIAGPPGCGKTTLVSSYLHDRKVPCLWYQVDAGDADAATFFYYLGLAAKSAAPRRREPLPLFTPEYIQGVPTFTLRYFEKLYARLRNPGVVVFDNYQEAPQASPFHEVILNGLSQIPEGVNVILISRRDPSPILTRLYANHLMKILGWNELRLTLEETMGIVRLRMNPEGLDGWGQHLHSTTDGWAAGLILMVESAKRGAIDPQLTGKLPPEEIFRYSALNSLTRPIGRYKASSSKHPFCQR